MDGGLIVTGLPRSGTTLLYCMLQYSVRGYLFDDGEHCSVRGYLFDDGEHWRLARGRIRKSPRAIFKGFDGASLIAMIRHPFAVLTSRHPRFPEPWFVSAHSCANDKQRGLCEWWDAIKRSGAVIVRYEHLCADADAVQDMLGKRLGLTYANRFRDFHKGKYAGAWVEAMGGLRPLAEPRHASRSHSRIQDQLAQHPELRDIVTEMGYASWPVTAAA